MEGFNIRFGRPSTAVNYDDLEYLNMLLSLPGIYCSKTELRQELWLVACEQERNYLIQPVQVPRQLIGK